MTMTKYLCRAVLCTMREIPACLSSIICDGRDQQRSPTCTKQPSVSQRVKQGWCFPTAPPPDAPCPVSRRAFAVQCGDILLSSSRRGEEEEEGRQGAQIRLPVHAQRLQRAQHPGPLPQHHHGPREGPAPARCPSTAYRPLMLHLCMLHFGKCILICATWQAAQTLPTACRLSGLEDD